MDTRARHLLDLLLLMLTLCGTITLWCFQEKIPTQGFFLASLLFVSAALYWASRSSTYPIVTRSLATCVVITNIRTAECETNKWILYKKID